MRKKSFFKIAIVLLFAGFISACKNGSIADQNSVKRQNNPLDSLTQLIEKQKDKPELYFERAKVYKAKLQANNAILDIQKAIELDNKNTDYFLFLADMYLSSNQVQGCINTLLSVLKDHPNHIEANLKMAELNLMFKRYAAVIESANTVLKVDPYNGQAFFMKAFTYKEKGDTSLAMSNFLECIKNDPKHYKAQMEMGLILSQKDDPIAIQYFKNAIDIEPNKVDAYYNLGLFYQNHDYYNEAQDVYRKINTIDPNFPYSYYNIGYILLEVSHAPSEAKVYFADAIRVKPDYFEAHFNLGLCFEELGNLIEAKKCYQNALKYQNNYDKAIEGLNRLDRLNQQ